VTTSVLLSVAMTAAKLPWCVVADASGACPGNRDDCFGEVDSVALLQQQKRQSANLSSAPAKVSWKMLDLNAYLTWKSSKPSYPMSCAIKITEHMLGPDWNCVFDGDSMPPRACFASGPRYLLPASCGAGYDPPHVKDLNCYKVTYSYPGCKNPEDPFCGSTGQWGCKEPGCPAYERSILIAVTDLYGAASDEMPFEIAQNAITGLCPNLCGFGNAQCAVDASACIAQFPATPPNCWPSSPDRCVPPAGNVALPLYSSDSVTFKAVTCPETSMG